MECTISLTLNTAGEKSSIGADRAAAAVKIKQMEEYDELILKKELTFLYLLILLLFLYFVCLLGHLLVLPFQSNTNTISVNLFMK